MFFYPLTFYFLSRNLLSEMKNTNQLELVVKLKNLTPGNPFFVKTEYDRQQVTRLAKGMKLGGFIAIDVITKKEGNQFKVAAI